MSYNTKPCLPTPFDFNDLLFVAALSRQKPRVRVTSRPPILRSCSACGVTNVTAQIPPDVSVIHAIVDNPFDMPLSLLILSVYALVLICESNGATS